MLVVVDERMSATGNAQKPLTRLQMGAFGRIDDQGEPRAPAWPGARLRGSGGRCEGRGRVALVCAVIALSRSQIGLVCRGGATCLPEEVQQPSRHQHIERGHGPDEDRLVRPRRVVPDPNTRADEVAAKYIRHRQGQHESTERRRSFSSLFQVIGISHLHQPSSSRASHWAPRAARDRTAPRFPQGAPHSTNAPGDDHNEKLETPQEWRQLGDTGRWSGCWLAIGQAHLPVGD